MQRLTRHRKAFYQKENDYKNGNQKLEQYKTFNGKYMQQKHEEPHSSMQHKVPQLQVKKVSKNDTQFYCEIYSPELLNGLINYQIAPKFLNNHKIDTNLRARMLDWMVEVMTSYKFSHKAYFAGIQLMDRYFQKEIESIHPTKLHIIGVVCMMIASKMEEVYPLKLKTVYQKIAHKKISEYQLTELQARISYALNFKLNSWTFFDLALAKLHILLQVLACRRIGALTNISNNYFSTPQNERILIKQIQQKQGQITELLSYISKCLMYDYEFYCSGSLSLLSDVVLKLCFEILKIPCQMESVFTSPPIEVELYKEKLKQNLRKFDQKFKGINNIKKFTNQEVVNLVQREIFNELF